LSTDLQFVIEKKDRRCEPFTEDHKRKIGISIMNSKHKQLSHKFIEKYTWDPQILHHCGCGRLIFDHPNLPNSDTPATDVFCPYLQMIRLGVL
jgi:hypothetical protein